MTTAYRRPVTVADQAFAEQCARGRVIIIDDDDQVLSALAALITLEGYACETYLSAFDYLQILSDKQPRFPGPSCLLCDVKMPELDGLELQKRLQQQDDTPFLLMSGASGAHEAASAFRAGALDFLIKPIDASELLAAVAKAMLLSNSLHTQHRRASALASRIASLTLREREVARYVSQGLTNPAIARQLGLALRTVKLHRQNAMEKLAADTTAELVRLADEGNL
ncbi:MAG: response regulator transcription factor [Comamonadaceae bacterium]|nr:response regulator transcription factor [Comamonadaceae bacterium]